MLTDKFSRDKLLERLAMIGILVMAIFFRWFDVQRRMVFSGETNNMLYYLQSYLAGQKPWLLGLEAAQYVHHLFHLPWYLWSMIPLFVISKGNPLAFAGFHAVVGAIGAYLIYRIGILLGSSKLGLLAAFGYAAAFPLSVIERFVSPVSLVPLGVVGVLYFGLKANKNGGNLRFFLVGFWAGVIVSFHYALLLTVAVGLGWIWLRRKEYFIAGATGVLAAFSPLLIFDLRNHFFNLTGLWYVGQSLFDTSRPYGFSHFLYQFYPLLILAVAAIVVRFPKGLIIIAGLMFLLSQITAWTKYDVHPNYQDRQEVVSQLLDRWDNGLQVYFQDTPSFDYGYLLHWEAKRRGLSPAKIEIYEPWQGENLARLVVRSDNVTTSQ